MMHSTLSTPKKRPHGTRLMRVLTRVVPIALIAIFALSLTGCDKDVQKIEAKEGDRIFLNNLFYQVQLSRVLNPKDVEDGFYLTDQPVAAKGESYFGVFMRVDNETNDTRILPSGIDKMHIENASGDEFEPIVVKGKGWAYAPAPLGKGASLPIPDTPAQIGPIKGGLILFKIPYSGLDSRPLKLFVKSTNGKTGEIILDV
jgi:hypothetical protein